MLTGLRASDANTLQRLCGADQRLFMRIGTLLQNKLAISEMALGAIVDDNLKSLVMDDRLKQVQPAEFAAMVTGAGGKGLVMIGDAEGKAEPGWRVIAVEDELDNPLLSRSEPPVVEAVVDLEPIKAMLSTLSPALRIPVEGLLNASADDQRAAALEQLRYATPPLPVVSELMPMILADGAELVRERAIGLLMASGANMAVIDLIRALQRGDATAMQRLAETVAKLPPLQTDVVIAAIMASAGRGQTSQTLVNVCQRLAAHLAVHRSLERLFELLLPNRLSLVELVRALQEHDSARVNAILRKGMGQGDEADAQIIILLAGPGTAGDDSLLDRGVELLLSSQEAPVERMALAGALRRLDAKQTLAKRIAAYGMRITESRDTTVHWLLAELCRDQAVSAQTANDLAVILRRLLREAPGPHVVAAIEQQLPALILAEDATRGALVEPLGETVARFRDERSREQVASAIVSIGVSAITPCWRLLEEHSHQPVRQIAAAALAEIIINQDAALVAKAVTRLLAGIEKAKEGAEKSALLTAAARLTNAQSLKEPESFRKVDAACAALGEWSIDALGHLGSGPHIDPNRRLEILEQMLAALTAELPDAPMLQSVDPTTQDTTFVLDSRLGVHTENVPRLLASLYRIGCSPHLPPQLLRRLVERLCEQWTLVSSWQVIWGPGNIQELGKVLGQLAERETFPGTLRVRICEALLPRLSQLSVARSLARVFAAAHGSYLSELAGRTAERMITLAGDAYFADDEQEEFAEVLVDYLTIPHLGATGDAIRRRLAGVIAANRSHVGARSRARLRAAVAHLDDEIKQRLEWA